MYILYIDGSGSVRNPGEQYFVLAGVSIFERQIYHLIRTMDAYVDSLGLDAAEDIELHASEIAAGRKKPWKGISRKRRLEIIEGALDAFLDTHKSTHLFAVAVDKQYCAPNDPVEYAFEEICNRFNLQLRRIYHRSSPPKTDAQRGLVVMDKSDNYESALQSLARKFRSHGTRWGNLRNMAEVPLFVDSRASRLVQLADLVAWAVWRRYQQLDTRFFDRISSRFDAEGGVVHGLVHFTPGHVNCSCPACLTRSVRDRSAKRQNDNFGS